MKKIFTSVLSAAMLAGIAASTTACKGWRNNFAYDIDFNADVNGTEIEFWTGFGSDINNVMGDILETFTKLTGVKVKYESKSSYDNVLNAVQLAATSGKFPNVTIGYPDHFATYVNQDIIVRLDYYFEHDVHSSFEPEGEEFEIDDFYKDYMRENQSIEFDAEGKGYTLGVPFNKSTETLIYNSTFFDWCATDTSGYKDTIYVPETWNEVDEVGQAILDMLDAKDAYGKYLLNDGSVVPEAPADPKSIVLNLHGISKWNDSDTEHKTSFKPFSYDSQANLFITALRQNEATYTYYDKEVKHGYVGFTSEDEKMTAAMNKIKTLYDHHTFGIPADWDEAKYGSNPFKAQKTVMTLGSSAGVANDAPSGNAFQIKAAPVPYFTKEHKAVISQGANLALLDKGSRKQRLASWLLVKFLSKYANGTICAQTGYYPASEFAEEGGMWVGTDVDEYVDYDSWRKSITPLSSTSEKIKAQVADVNIDTYVNKELEHKWLKFVDQPFPGSASIRTEIANATKYMLIDKMSIKAAIEKVFEKIPDYIKK